MRIREAEQSHLGEVVELHNATFPGFFLTFLGPGFLKCLYSAFLTHPRSQLLISEDEQEKMLGFAAFTNNLSELYRHLLRSSIIPLAWYSFLALLRRPSVVFRLLRGLSHPQQSERTERYAELSSIGVAPQHQKSGVGRALVEEVIKRVDFSEAAYLKLETDADQNADVNAFYLRNGFVLHHTYATPEGRKMNEYHYTPMQEMNTGK